MKINIKNIVNSEVFTRPIIDDSDIMCTNNSQ